MVSRMSQIEGGRSGGGGSLTVLDDLVEFCGDLGHGWQCNAESRVIRVGWREKRSGTGRERKREKGGKERKPDDILAV